MIAAATEQLIKIVRVALPVEVLHDGRIQVVELARLTWTFSVDGWDCTAVVLVGRQRAHDGIHRIGDLTCEQYDPRSALDLPAWLPTLISHLAPADSDGLNVAHDDGGEYWPTEHARAALPRRSVETASETRGGSSLASTDASPGAGRDAEGDGPASVPLGHPLTEADVVSILDVRADLLGRRPR